MLNIILKETGNNHTQTKSKPMIGVFRKTEYDKYC